MIKVDNKHIIRDVSKKTYNANKKRNLLTIFAIFLTTFSILTIIGIGIGSVSYTHLTLPTILRV